jgi:aryl-alcohol dehydrogenase-like predicted oxidoreductase
MQKVNIPKADLLASMLALGTDYFGSTVGRELSMQITDKYFESGDNVIDTADLYARWVPGGEHQSEKTVGE